MSPQGEAGRDGVAAPMSPQGEEAKPRAVMNHIQAR